jgi:hypothetical protein
MQDMRISDLHRKEEGRPGCLATCDSGSALIDSGDSATLAGKGTKIKMLQISLQWVFEYIRLVPDIRRDKVREMRRRVLSGSWNPQSTRIAEKILYEHLFDPEPSPPASPERAPGAF